jgi:sigma-B regulation protein RsbU (phosphoserine phosphatase)
MAECRTLIRNICAKEKTSPASVLDEANRFLSKDNETCMFVTVFLIYYDIQSGTFSYANAGHNPAMLFNLKAEKREFGFLANPPLGLFPDQSYAEKQDILPKGDLLFLYTDGMTDARFQNGELFGERRIHKSITGNISLSVEEINRKLFKAVFDFQGENQFDDMTILAIRRN